MTKLKKISSQQTNLFDWIKKAEELTRQAESPPKGSLYIDKELKTALTEDIRHAKDKTGRELSRVEIQRIDEEMKCLKNEKLKRKLFLKEIERGS